MNPSAVRSAAARIAGQVHRTPVRTSATLDGRTGAQVLVKDEAVQKTGSFKARGALNRQLTLPDEARERGLVCVTAGNHGAAVAWAAAQTGAKATVVMPTYSPAAKVAACWSYGAEVILHGDTTTEAFAECERLQGERGLTFVHPFDDPEIVAGQGTVALELVEDAGPVDVWVVSVGGGGLTCGTALAVRDANPDCRVVAVEPEGAAALTAALAAGRPVPIVARSVADGLCAPFAGPLTFPLFRDLVDEVVPAAGGRAPWPGSVRRGTDEGRGRAGRGGHVAALLAGRAGDLTGQRVGTVLTGGNLDLGVVIPQRRRPTEGPLGRRRLCRLGQRGDGGEVDVEPVAGDDLSEAAWLGAQGAGCRNGSLIRPASLRDHPVTYYGLGKSHNVSGGSPPAADDTSLSGGAEAATRPGGRSWTRWPNWSGARTLGEPAEGGVPGGVAVRGMKHWGCWRRQGWWWCGGGAGAPELPNGVPAAGPRAPGCARTPTAGPSRCSGSRETAERREGAGRPRPWRSSREGERWLRPREGVRGAVPDGGGWPHLPGGSSVTGSRGSGAASGGLGRRRRRAVRHRDRHPPAREAPAPGRWACRARWPAFRHVPSERDGATLVRLSHHAVGPIDDETRAAYEHGWVEVFGALQGHLGLTG